MENLNEIEIKTVYSNYITIPQNPKAESLHIKNKTKIDIYTKNMEFITSIQTKKIRFSNLPKNAVYLKYQYFDEKINTYVTVTINLPNL